MKLFNKIKIYNNNKNPIENVLQPKFLNLIIWLKNKVIKCKKQATRILIKIIIILLIKTRLINNNIKIINNKNKIKIKDPYLFKNKVSKVKKENKQIFKN